MSQPCIWNRASRKRKVDNIPIQQVKFVKHEHGKSKTFQKGADPATKDERAVHQRNLSATDLYNFRDKLECLPIKDK